MLESAIDYLYEKRRESSEEILNKLADLMLEQMAKFGLTSITKVKFSRKFAIQFLQDGKLVGFDRMAEGEQLRAKLAFYLSLIQLDIEHKAGRHTRFLIIDSPGKEEGDAEYLSGLATVFQSINESFGEELQILIGTAERDLVGVLPNETVIQPNEFLF